MQRILTAHNLREYVLGYVLLKHIAFIGNQRWQCVKTRSESFLPPGASQSKQ